MQVYLEGGLHRWRAVGKLNVHLQLPYGFIRVVSRAKGHGVGDLDTMLSRCQHGHGKGQIKRHSFWSTTSPLRQTPAQCTTLKPHHLLKTIIDVGNPLHNHLLCHEQVIHRTRQHHAARVPPCGW